MITLIEYNEKNFKSEGELFNIITDAMHQNGIKYIPHDTSVDKCLATISSE